METWEYAALRLEGGQAYWTVLGSGEGELVPPDEWDGRVAAAGRDGWELVTADRTDVGETLNFKRRSSQD